MRKFLNSLFRSLPTAKPTRHRANLRVESLEERLVPTSVSSQGSLFTVDCSPNQTILFEQANGTIEVFENGHLAGSANRAATKTVDIVVAGNDAVGVDDSNGMPFIINTTINLEGSGSGNSLALFGSRSIDTGEDYIVGGTATAQSTILVDNLTFTMTSAIASVNDTLQLTGGSLAVATSGSGVILTSSGSEQTFFNLGPGGGGTLSFANKSQVVLNEFGAATQVFLEASAAATGEQSVSLVLRGTGDTATIFATPSNVTTNVTDDADSIVKVQANSGFVDITGNNTTNVTLGAADLQASVEVNGAGSLAVVNTGPITQDVTVSQSTISGTGLFGNNSVVVSYFNVDVVGIDAGSGKDHYTIQATKLGDAFTSFIAIVDTASTKSFVVDVFVDSGSNLNSHLVNFAEPDVAELIVHHHLGKFSDQKDGATSGDATVTFPDSTSQVHYDFFATVKAESF